jgi:aryl-alcohol dehydrogenase-like predicted oxidoreductase
MRLVLGTVQFGAPYGVANSAGTVPLKEVEKILNYAKSKSVNRLDTAASYGQSEAVIGEIGVREWKVITKIPPLNESVEDVESWIFNQIESSIARLKVERLEGVLLHRPEDILGHNSQCFIKALHKLRDTGKVSKIGYSIYSPNSLQQLTDKFWPDLVQAPYNVFDQRISLSGWLDRLVSKGSEIYARSIFLQGLLVMPASLRPAYFSRWRDLLNGWDRLVIETGLTPLELALSFVVQEKKIDYIVVGVDSFSQFKFIHDSYEKKLPINFMSFSSQDEDLIDPFRWVVR